MRGLTEKSIVAAALLIFQWATQCGAQVTLQWNPSTDQTVVGYNLVWGMASRRYTSTNSYPTSQTLGVITGLASNQAYYVNIATFNRSGMTSPYGGEIVFTNILASTNGTGTSNAPVITTLSFFEASTNAPPSPTGGGSGTVTSGNGGGGSSIGSTSPSAANAAAMFWGVPPRVSIIVSNNEPNLNIAGTIGATLMIEATTNIFSTASWQTMTNISLTNVAPVALASQQTQPQDALDVAFVPAFESMPITDCGPGRITYYRAVMPYDYVVLAGNVLSTNGYVPRLVLVNMPGIISDDACYVTEGSSFIHYDKSTYALQLEGSGPTIRSIAGTLASSLGLDWTSASEFTYSNGIAQIVSTVVQTEPASSDPVPGKTRRVKPSTIIDF
jgi:hypothetical protein